MRIMVYCFRSCRLKRQIDKGQKTICDSNRDIFFYQKNYRKKSSDARFLSD